MGIPASWPPPSGDEILPEVFLSLADSSWPPATDVTPAGVAELSSWEMTREIVGNTLPGQLRGTVGLSIGDAQVIARQSDGKPMAPWGRGDRRVTGGAKASLYASHSGPSATDRLDLGSWLVDPMSGSLASPELGIDLLEASYAARIPNLLTPAFTIACEAAWIVDTLARQSGFYATPAPVDSCVLSVPMQGHVVAERGVMTQFSGWPLAWDKRLGVISPDGGLAHTYSCDGGFFSSTLSNSRFLSATVSGTVTFNLAQDAAGAPQIEIRPGGVIAVRNDPADSWTTGTYVAGLNPDHPLRVEIEVQRDGLQFDWGTFRARARSSSDAAFGSWVNASAGSSGGNWADGVRVTAASPSSAAGIQFCTTSLPGVWAKPNARIDPLLGLLVAPWIPGDLDAWKGIQEVCGSHLAAAWVTSDGDLTVRNRDYLAGASGEPVQTVIVDDQLADLGWSTDPADTADRIEVTYNPVDYDFGTAPTSYPIAWRAPDVLEVGGGQTLQVVADLEAYSDQLRPWIPWSELASGSIFKSSAWSAYPNRNGTGTVAPATAIAVTHTQVSAGRAIISVTNRTASPLFMVAADGGTGLVLCATSVGRQESTATVTRGASAEVAKNPVTIDLGKYVHRPVDVDAIADYIWARVSVPRWTAAQLRIKRDLSLDIGQILLLVHPDSDLRVKVLITGIALKGEPGDISQTLTVVVLPPTWADFDAAWLAASKTWTTGFDPVWAGSNFASFDFDPLKAA